jgi:hypothetical protein
MLKNSILLLMLTLSVPTLLRAADISTPSPGQKQATPTASPFSPRRSVPQDAAPSPTASTTPSAALSPKIFADHLNPIDHAGVWTKFDFSYDYAVQTELINGAAAINNQSYVNPGGLGSYTGSVVADRNGLGLGFELGFLRSPSSGIALGAHYLQTDEYNADVNYPNAGPDSESVTLLPTVVPITLDYYFFMPDGGGRFFLSAGVGYYIANVRVRQFTTSDNFFGSNNTPGQQGGDIWEGNVSSAAIGFQASLGREFAVSDRLGIVLFAGGRYAKISNFQGQLLDSNAVAGKFALASGVNGVVDIDSPSNITGANNERYAIIDFTGFDAGVALNFYGF